MPYVTRHGQRRPRPAGATNGVQRCVALDGTKLTFECLHGHRMVKDFAKGPKAKQVGEAFLRHIAPSWGLGLLANGTRGHCYGWCQKCQNETDEVK